MCNSRGDGEDRFRELSTTLRRKFDDRATNSIPTQELKKQLHTWFGMSTCWLWRLYKAPRIMHCGGRGRDYRSPFPNTGNDAEEGKLADIGILKLDAIHFQPIQLSRRGASWSGDLWPECHAWNPWVSRASNERGWMMSKHRVPFWWLFPKMCTAEKY